MDYTDIILKAAETFRLDVNLIKSIIKVESAGNTWATRFEPTWRYYYNLQMFSQKLNCTVSTETAHQQTSWGLCQIMGSVARELGFTDHLPMLCTPEIGVFYGCKKLRQLSDKYGDEDKVIVSYNAGSPVYTLAGTYVNERYLDSVSSVLRTLRQLQ